MNLFDRPLTIAFVCLFVSIRSGAQTDTANYLYADSSFYKTWKLEINGPASDDFSPLIYNKGIIFTSDRENDFGVVYYDKESQKHLLDIYYTEKTDSFKFATPKPFSSKINSAYHDGPACFSADEQTIYFTTNGRKEQKKVLMIYTSQLVNGEWTEPEPIKLNDPEYSVAHPALSHDGQTLYFVSDMPGGIGGTDIYMSKKDINDEWSKPINLGPEINTKKSEKFPFIDANGVLYFSSDGHGGIGKLDIFSASKKTDGHYELKNMGYPINSTADDFGFTCDSLFTRGFYSSSRKDVHDNIYGFYSSLPKFCNCDTVKSSSLCYTFFEERAMADKDTAGMTYEWDLGDGAKAKGMSIDHCYSSPGKYAVKLNVIDNSTGVLFYTQSSYDIDAENSNALTINVPDSFGINNSIALDGKGSMIPGYTIKNYYWKLDDHDYRTGIKTEVNYSSPGEKKIRLAVFGQDDKTKQLKEFCVLKTVFAVNDKNFSLSKHTNAADRSNFAFKIHVGSTKYKIPVNTHYFKSAKELNDFFDKGLYHYTAGETKELINALPYFNAARIKGIDATLLTFENDKLIPNQDAIIKGTIKDTAAVQAYTIFFNQGETELNAAKKINMDGIYSLLVKDPELKIDIIAQTDGKGPADYNLKLSKDRANSIKSYLVSKGCKVTRIITLAYSEKTPVGDDATDEGKRANRRADIILHE